MHLIQSVASKELVRNLPKLKFDQYFCDACKIRKQAHASHKAKNIVSTTRCLELRHMDLFGPSAARSYGGSRCTLVIVDDYSKYTWTRFLKDKTKAFDQFEIFSACIFTDRWSLDELAYGVPKDGPYQTNLPSPDDIILSIQIDKEGQVRRIRHEKEIDVLEYQVLTREIEPTLKHLEEIIQENVFCLGGHDEVFLGMKMVGSGMLMVVVVVAVVGEIEVYRMLLVYIANSSTYVTMPANEGHLEFDACCRQSGSIRTAGESSSISFRAENRCQEVISSLQKHADFGIVAFDSPSREGSGFHDSDPKELRHKVLSLHLLRSSDRVDVALKFKQEENKAYLFERPLAKKTMKSKLLKDLTESDRIVGELLQLGGYLKLIEFGLDDCVDGIKA
ncbi:retrovirus-related pol polyprotein from transposon TNT 1-94 [Tanacetum coccineum]